MKNFGFSWNFAYLKRGDDIYVVQLKMPFFSILHSYYSDDAGLVMTYIRYAIPKKYEQERPI